MKTVAKIIELFGGLDWLKLGRNYIRLENEPYMRLVIEYVGVGPRGLPLISVAHYYEQNGDAMRDPEVVFEVNQEAVFVGDDGQVLIRPKLVRDLKSFVRTWDNNIKEQGFCEVAQTRAAPLTAS